MLQLKVYDTPSKVNQYWIDLYDTEPIKLTLSIEDITNADATSTYSKTFKVPGTRRNNEFFKNAFDIDGVLYDVTVKKPAEILVDGSEFKQGHIRLQRIFKNEDLDQIDYELLFLGETRDFSSLIGDAGLCELIMPDLIGDCSDPTGITSGPLEPDDIQTSWLAYPQSASITAGLANGNIIYPLMDHGNTYDASGDPEQPEVRTQGSHAFTSASHQLPITQLKPMIRAKRIWDQIFQNAGYTYTSDFLESDLFQQIYISAFGNEASPRWTPDGGTSANTMFAHETNSQDNTGRLLVNDIIQDPGGNYTQIGGYSVYIAPADGTYTISMSVYYSGYNENSDYSAEENLGQLEIYNATTFTQLAVSGYGNNTTLNVQWTGELDKYDQIVMNIDNYFGVPDTGYTINARFEVLEAPGELNPASLLDCQYKQIDFIKDILTAFRLVLSPDPYKPNNFIVEPWQTYINSGDLHDWSHKLVENKEVTIEPVFFSQSENIEFHFQPGGDWVNLYHLAAYNNNEYGYLQFDSNNDLLKGEREIKLIGIAPTELIQVENSDPADMFVVAQMHIHESEEGETRHLPIKPKTRMLFYNGLQTIQHNPDRWYLAGAGANPQEVWPLVSPYQHWPIQSDSLTLNWANDVQYWGIQSGYNKRGITLYDNYWSRYIESLYNKFARRVTAYFVLNNVDLNYFSFDDTIFVNGVYYRPEKIVDLQVGDYTEVQVQLLTANDYRPTFIQDEELTGVLLEAFNDTCGEGLGYIDVTTNGTPEFTWALNNGMTGTALVGAPAGNAPYTFQILNVPPGVWTLTLTDALGRDFAQDVTVPINSGAAVTATYVLTEPTCLGESCDGGIQITPSGGVGPYTITWLDGAAGLDTIVRLYTNVPESGDQFHQSFRVGAFDAAFNPPYDEQSNEFNPWFWREGAYNYGGKYSPLVINEENSTTQPWFSGSVRELRIPAGVAGTFTLRYNLELTNVQGLDLTGDQFWWQVIINGQTTTFINVPNLPTDGTPVPFNETFEYTSDGTQATYIRILFRYLDGGTPAPIGPIVGYRGTFEVTVPGGGTRYDLCPGQQYSFYVTDSLGCQSPVYSFTPECPPAEQSYIARKHSPDCTQLGLTDYIVTAGAPIDPLDVFSINGLDGCYSVIASTLLQPVYTVNQFYIDCAACQGLPANNVWDMVSCDGLEYTTTDFDGIIPSVGEVYEVNGRRGCWEVVAPSENAPLTTVLTGPYGDCNECTGGGGQLPMYTDSAEGNGELLANCQVKVHPIPIYCNNTFDPSGIQAGDIMYVDNALTDIWNGGNLWYKIAPDPTVTGNYVAIQVNNLGSVLEVAYC